MESFMESFMTGNNGNRAEDYYYTFSAKGDKCYHSYLTGKRVAKADIPKRFVDKIQEKDAGLDIDELTNLKQGYLGEIKKLEEKIKAIDVKLNHLNANDEEVIKENLRKKEERDRENIERKREMEQEAEERFRKLFEEGVRKNKQEDSILVKIKITNKDEWKKWLVKNHTDKGGNNDICQQVIAAGRAKGW